MFLLSLVLGFRILESVAQSTSLTYLQKAEHAEFLKANDRAVVIYDDELEPLSFIEYPILRYAGRIAFAFANDTLAPTTACTKTPCIVGYYKGSPLPLGDYAPSAILFTTWCERVLTPYELRIVFGEEIITAFQRSEPCIFVIGNAKTARLTSRPMFKSTTHLSSSSRS
jgi:hypothetical protein